MAEKEKKKIKSEEMNLGESKSYRIRASVGTNEQVINVKLEQDYDLLEILSLNLNQEDTYKLYTSDYGVIVGRVLANQSFGIPNAKVSVFIEVENADIEDVTKGILYPYRTVTTPNSDNIRYNLLPDSSSDECHQVVGTFPNKRLVLDNNDLIEIFDKYWKYTTTTNNAGDYMIFGVPTGNTTVHVDLDMSDIGVLSQRPRDMIYKGYNINQFESPNQFKTSTNLDSLSQIYTQNTSVYVYPFWGDSTLNTIAVTRADVQIQYLFEPTCVFMGCVVTDSNGNSIGKNCVGYKNLGKMDNLVSGEGTIEMIRKTINGTVEEFQVQGTRLIDGDGTWCYQIPMNLDYVGTDEYGNIVPTDDPNKGIPTRARVRFRIALDDTGTETSNKKRGKMLVPNNPKFKFDSNHEIQPLTDNDIDYEFGTNTREESYRDLFWNKVYTVKSYIPRLQRSRKVNNKKFIGFKQINEYGQNSPMPFNNLRVHLTLVFRLLCTLSKIIIGVIKIANIVIGIVVSPLVAIIDLLDKVLNFEINLGIWKIRPFAWIWDLFFDKLDDFLPKCITVPESFCEDDPTVYAPGCWLERMQDITREKWAEDWEEGDNLTEDGEERQVRWDEEGLIDCVENQLAQENGVFNFDFYNDWINGMIYIPLWLRKVRKKKKFLFGLIKRKSKIQYCSTERKSTLRLYMPCAIPFNIDTNQSYTDEDGNIQHPAIIPADISDDSCHKTVAHNTGSRGIINEKKTILGQNVYYYRPIDGKNRLFATDIVLLGSLNDCDIDGLPQAFRYLEPTTYNMPPDKLLTESGDDPDFNDDGSVIDKGEYSEMSGVDWGFPGSDLCPEKKDNPGAANEPSGIFLGIYCNKSKTYVKSCVNLERVCELGVGLDERQEIINRQEAASKGGNWADNEDSFPTIVLTPDGYISKDELQDTDVRGMLATMNINGLRTVKDERTGLLKYDLRYTYPNNFDGKLKTVMERYLSGCSCLEQNASLENFSDDYYRYRFGNHGYGYYVISDGYRFPLYENSYYFYFGIKDGNTALDKFNTQFFSVCSASDAAPFNVNINGEPSSWCPKGSKDGSLTIIVGDVEYPWRLTYTNDDNNSISGQYQDLYNNSITITGLTNGDYTIVVTDASERSVSTEYSLQAEQLSFELDSRDFLYTYDELMEMVPCQTFDDNCRRAILEKYQYVTDTSSNQYIGGKLIVSNLMINGELIDFTNQNQYEVEVRDITNFSNTDAEGILPVAIRPTNSNQLTIQTWQGNVTYQVKITQKCTNGLSDNSNTFKIFVSEPKQMEYTINGIDFEYIKNFKGGYPNGDIYGWDDLGNINVYNWPDEWKDPIGQLLPEYEEEAKEIMQDVKNAFYLTCNSGRINLYVFNGAMPILYQINGVEEIYDAESGSYTLSPSGVTTFDGGTYLISDIQEPTLVGQSDSRAGTKLGDFGAINKNKPPYRVAIFTHNGDAGYPARPIGAQLENPDTWFQIHFIDKIFQFDLIVWVGYENFYHYGSGLMMAPYTWDGYMCGYILNGKADEDGRLVSVSMSDGSNGSENDVDYDTLNDEDELPTRRKLKNIPDLTYGEVYSLTAQDYCSGSDCDTCIIQKYIDNSLTFAISQCIVSEDSGATVVVAINDLLSATVYMAFKYTPGGKTGPYDDPFGIILPNSGDESQIYYSGHTENEIWNNKTLSANGVDENLDISQAYSLIGATFSIDVDWSSTNNTWFFVAITNEGERIISNAFDFNKISIDATLTLHGKVVSPLPLTYEITGQTLDYSCGECENWYANNFPVTGLVQVLTSEGEVVFEKETSANTISELSDSVEIDKDTMLILWPDAPYDSEEGGEEGGEEEKKPGKLIISVVDIVGTIIYCNVNTTTKTDVPII